MNLIESLRTALRLPVEPRPQVWVTGLLKDGQVHHLDGVTVDLWIVGELAAVRLRQEFAGLDAKIAVHELDTEMWGADPADRALAREVMARLVRSLNHDDWETAAL